MKIRKSKTGENELQRYGFFCPGCNCSHSFNDSWQFNGDFNNPTISPSILVTGEKRCHSFVKDGKIKFLSDCDHELKGQTVDLPEL